MRMRPIVKWGVRILAGALGFVAVVAAGAYGYSQVHMSHRFTVPEHPLTLRTDSATLAEGKRLATLRGCVDCHGANLGGSVMINEPAIGLLAAPNLTLGGRGKDLDLRDWERAVRHGVRRDGTSLRVMPAVEFTTMADDQLEAIVSYVRSVAPTSTVQPVPRMGPVIMALYVAGQVKLLPGEDIDHTKSHAAHIDPEPTAKYGEYLAIGCTGCHGPTLAGGKIAGAPPDWKAAANITPAGIGRYSEADFMRVMREGKRPDGSQVDSLMPYRLFKSMTDVELKAIYAYLKTVPAKAYGGR